MTLKTTVDRLEKALAPLLRSQHWYDTTPPSFWEGPEGQRLIEDALCEMADARGARSADEVAQCILAIPTFPNDPPAEAAVADLAAAVAD